MTSLSELPAFFAEVNDFTSARTPLESSTPSGQAEAIRHQQTWQPLSALHADPRCSCGDVSRQVRHRRVRAMGAPACSACPAQQSDCRDRQQAGVIAGRAVQLPGLLRCAWKAQPAFHFSTATTTAKTAREVEPSNAGNLKQLGHTGGIMKPMAAGILFVGVSSHASRRSDQWANCTGSQRRKRR